MTDGQRRREAAHDGLATLVVEDVRDGLDDAFVRGAEYEAPHAHAAGVRAGMEAAAKLVCEKCRQGKPRTGDWHDPVPLAAPNESFVPGMADHLCLAYAVHRALESEESEGSFIKNAPGSSDNLVLTHEDAEESPVRIRTLQEDEGER